MRDRDRTSGEADTPNEAAATPAKTGGMSAKTGDTSDGGALRHSFRPVLALMVLILLGLLATAGFKSYRDLDSAMGYERKLLDQITEAKERVRGLDVQIDRIRNDPAMLERLAREDLGLVRDGDVVIVLPDPRLASRTEASSPLPTRPSAPGAGSPSADAASP